MQPRRRIRPHPLRILRDRGFAVAGEVGRFDCAGVAYRFLRWDAALAGGGACVPEAPLVLLHGFSQRAESWDQVARLLARAGRTSYALDLAGHGESDRPAGPDAYALEAQGAMLREFLRWVAEDASSDGREGGRLRQACGSASGFGAAEGLPTGEGPSVGEPPRPLVVGYSMGGRVALAALAAAPDAFARRAGALVLESAGLGPVDEAARAEAACRDSDCAVRLRAQGIAAFMDGWERLPLFATQLELPPDVRACLAAERRANDVEALARTFEEAGQHSMPGRAAIFDALRGLAARGIPVLYLTGARDRKYVALAQEAHAAGVFPSPILVPDAGHNVHLEAPAAFVRTLVETFPVRHG